VHANNTVVGPLKQSPPTDQLIITCAPTRAPRPSRWHYGIPLTYHSLCSAGNLHAGTLPEPCLTSPAASFRHTDGFRRPLQTVWTAPVLAPLRDPYVHSRRAEQLDCGVRNPRLTLQPPLGRWADQPNRLGQLLDTTPHVWPGPALIQLLSRTLHRITTLWSGVAAHTRRFPPSILTPGYLEHIRP
jgi:hypothetical protein